MKTWVKWFTEINHDPKLGRMSWEFKGIWGALCALAGEIDELDSDGQPTGKLASLPDVAWMIRCDEDLLKRAIAAFSGFEDLEDNMIADRGGVLYLVNFRKRQGRAPSDSAGAVAERVKRHRERVTQEAERPCNEDVTPLQEDVTPLEKKENREEKETFPSFASAPAGYSDVFTAWFNATHSITDAEGDLLMPLVDAAYQHVLGLPRGSPGKDVSGDRWVVEAIGEAVKANQAGKVTLNFVSAILERWKRDGYKSKRQQPAAVGRRDTGGNGRGRASPPVRVPDAEKDYVHGWN